jgi:hypothetical protein
MHFRWNYRQIWSTDRSQRLFKLQRLPSKETLTSDSQASELSPSERVSSVPFLLVKLVLHRPKFLCLIGTNSWEDVCADVEWTSKASGFTSRASTKNMGFKPFKICYPPGTGPVGGTLLFVVNTSGRVVQYQVRIYNFSCNDLLRLRL